MDWLGPAVTIGSVAMLQIVQYVSTTAKHDKSIETAQGNHTKLESRVDDHDKQFLTLHEKFVSRLEMAQTLSDIRDSQKRTERLLDKMLLKRAGLSTEEE